MSVVRVRAGEPLDNKPGQSIWPGFLCGAQSAESRRGGINHRVRGSSPRWGATSITNPVSPSGRVFCVVLSRRSPAEAGLTTVSVVRVRAGEPLRKQTRSVHLAGFFVWVLSRRSPARGGINHRVRGSSPRWGATENKPGQSIWPGFFMPAGSRHHVRWLPARTPCRSQGPRWGATEINPAGCLAGFFVWCSVGGVPPRRD